MDALQTQTVISTTAPQPNYIPGLIAVVGCDGTGKSTLTTDLVKSLQQHWQTERRYLGLLSISANLRVEPSEECDASVPR